MIYIDFNNYLRASYSFALEEYIMQNADIFSDEYFLFWRTNPTLMIGKHQNTIEEINPEYVQKNNIDVVRRNSGGGAIYTDNGCWQYSFIVWKQQGLIRPFSDFTASIVKALQKMGVNTEFSGRNDLMVNGKKISGNAQYGIGDRFLHHGTILFDTEIDKLAAALVVNKNKIMRKGVASISEHVTNIKPYLNKQMCSTEFRDEMIKFLSNEMPTITLTSDVLAKIDAIEQQKFRTKEWNYGASPGYNVRREQQYDGGKVSAILLVEEGIIIECSIAGDFFMDGDIGEVENALRGCNYEKDSILCTLQNIPAASKIFGVTLDELVNVITN